jgi:hypothetical protein
MAGGLQRVEMAATGNRTPVATFTSDPTKLRELDADTRRAWNAYRDRTQWLRGEAYELAERESWTILQNELRRLERRRRLLIEPGPLARA